jgi:hypothetical protein
MVLEKKSIREKEFIQSTAGFRLNDGFKQVSLSPNETRKTNNIKS